MIPAPVMPLIIPLKIRTLDRLEAMLIATVPDKDLSELITWLPKSKKTLSVVIFNTMSLVASGVNAKLRDK